MKLYVYFITLQDTTGGDSDYEATVGVDPTYIPEEQQDQQVQSGSYSNSTEPG